MQTDLNNVTSMNEHCIAIVNRERMDITGVVDVISFSDEIVDLKTIMGGLIIKGRNLTINKLNTDTGQLDVIGEIISMEYKNIKNKDKDGFFVSLFK